MDQAPFKPRRWTVIASGLLCGALALIVLFTNPGAFYSPIAVMVVAAIGFVAILLQLRFSGRDQSDFHPPLWLNLLGAIFALAALFADLLHLSAQVTQVMALIAVGIFGISGALILHRFRRQRAAK